MFEYLKRMAGRGKLNKRILDKVVSEGWITKEQEAEILKIAAEANEEGGKGNE
ncbi:hypothetical protein HMPREF9624_00270 [Oribacterium asaccharolyticum ACB7]|uniref:XkdX family protein n=1 Tax=Oribacterium asaccharolyticum ACB7 TaxID=796944 RepID=G9WUE5_9FIRM|nr:hypothetical protein [Oribacterium asaccharolyticum]EHL11963.1 hypothetical protein HMPREF9624_00270 [Oribacterium asaccharolyticum ACB7]